VVESIEHLSPELDLDSFVYRKILDEPEVNIPVAGRREDVPACAILARSRYAERLSQVDATGKRIYRLEKKPVPRAASPEVPGAALSLVLVRPRALRDCRLK
jgi:hypothetical protein